MPETKELTAEEVAKRNDAIRATLPGRVTVADRVMLTQGIMALGAEVVADAINQTKKFDAFCEDNDPHGEHDFGSFEVTTGDKVFWKIDDYQGHDGIRCVITILLAEEY